MIKDILRSFGFITQAEAQGMANKALADMRNEVLRLTQINRGLVHTGETLANNHLTMHRRMVDAEKGLAHAEEEVRHLKSILVEERQQAMSLVTQAVTDRSQPVTGLADKQWNIKVLG